MPGASFAAVEASTPNRLLGVMRVNIGLLAASKRSACYRMSERFFNRKHRVYTEKSRENHPGER